jgi:hypothetical protein
MPENLEFEPDQTVGFVPKWLRLCAWASRLVDPLTVTATDVDDEVIWRCAVTRGEQGSFTPEVPFPGHPLRPPLRIVIEGANGDSVADTITAEDLDSAIQ